MAAPETESVSVENTALLRRWRRWVLVSFAMQTSMVAFIVALNLSALADAASRSSGSQSPSPKPEQYTRMLPTSKDDCTGLSILASAIASNREKGMSRQRQRVLFMEGFARDHATPPVFPHFQRATLFSWLLDDLYGPSAFLSGIYAMRAIETWCHTAVVTSHRERVRFTLALLTPDLLDAISGCTAGSELGPALVRLRDHGLPLADAMAILREGIVQGIVISSSHGARPPYDIMEAVKRTWHKIDENMRVVGHVATAIYADVNLTETTSIEQVPRLCVEVWIP